MPEFVDFMLAFGISEHSKDFLYSGFRSEMYLSNDNNRLLLPELGRSGREIRLCHILRSVERVDSFGGSQQLWPWVLRPTVTYHSFDVETKKSVWMVVKANDLIRDRIRRSCEASDLYQPCSDTTFDRSFESTLQTHLVICAWAGENWRWYINFIEERIQDLTREALVEQAEDAPFSFADLQKVHYVEEKANEALLVLEANAAVIQELREFYTNAKGALKDAPLDASTVVSAVGKFHSHLDVTAKDLKMQQARSRMLLKLLSDRKSLVRTKQVPDSRTWLIIPQLASMLQWKATQSNFDLAQEAQTSTKNMEAMTQAMHTIAHETKMEAVNMRIITLVTLFFLPGTFVSVSVALYLVAAFGLTPMETLMSTPIVHYPDDQRIVNRDALSLFLAISLPLLAFTIITCYALYKWHKARVARSRRLEECGSGIWSDTVLQLKNLTKHAPRISMV